MRDSVKAKPFEEELQFLRGLIASPKSVGAIAPSSPALARAVVAQVDQGRPGPILELGPGTGSMTRELLNAGIAPGRLTLIEYDADFAQLLRERFPGVPVVCGDAFDLDRTLGKATEPCCAIISGIPLLNHPVELRQKLVGAVLDRLAPGAPFIQFSYGFNPPVAAPAGASVSRAAFVFMNLPPARVWVYRRNG